MPIYPDFQVSGRGVNSSRASDGDRDDLARPDPDLFRRRTATGQRAFAAAFSADAMIHDEGAIHRGPVEIVAWWTAAKARYRHRGEPLDMTEAGGKLLVRARVTGDFPGSPAVLTFTFGLSGDRIRDLRIG